jgi:transcriptional regulator with XRE-family HTH domain
MEEKEFQKTKQVRIHLDKLLKEKGWTQQQLSEISEVRQAAISQLSRGFVSRISIDHIERLATALELDSISELIEIYPYRPLFDETDADK